MFEIGQFRSQDPDEYGRNDIFGLSRPGQGRGVTDELMTMLLPELDVTHIHLTNQDRDRLHRRGEMATK